MKADDAKLSLYTFVFDFRGGTYLSQFQAADPVDAKRRWAIQLQTSGIDGLEKFAAQKLVEEIEHDMVPVTGLTDVWCFTVLFDDHLGVIHVVSTSQKRK